MKTNNTQTNLMQNTVNAFAAQGYCGKQLTLRVFAAGYFMALAAGNTEAAERFAARHAEEECK
jgi:hypothetical protein